MPLTRLDVRGTQVSDLSPLQGIPLTQFSFDPTKITTGLDTIRNMKSLTHINSMPTAEFWKKYDAREFRQRGLPDRRNVDG